jgi:hypothetical protein
MTQISQCWLPGISEISPLASCTHKPARTSDDLPEPDAPTITVNLCPCGLFSV